MQVPEQGQLVYLRNRFFLVQDVSYSVDQDHNVSHKVTLEYLDDDKLGEVIECIWEVEPYKKLYEAVTLPKPEQWDHKDLFDSFISAIRWSSGSLIDTTGISSPFYAAITIEDYQLEPIARALVMPRVNLLIADDVGLGKTIEAGLVAQELLLRQKIRRILVICPASLQLKWRDEMMSKFQLDFRIMDREEIQRLRREFGINVNPWSSFPRLITSFDFLKRDQPLSLFRQSLQRDKYSPLRDWDLLIVDEAHNVAPSGRKNYVQDSDRTKMMLSIIDNFEHRLFLTATPHNGYTPSFTALLEMLDPLRFSRGLTIDQDQLKAVMIRRLKEDIKDSLGNSKFANRAVSPITVTLSESENKIFELLAKYTDSRLKNTDAQHAIPIRFALIVLKKRLLSSPFAFYKSIETHKHNLGGDKEDIKDSLASRLTELAPQDWDNDEEKSNYEMETLQEVSKTFRNVSKEENRWLEELMALAKEGSSWIERMSDTEEIENYLSSDSKCKKLLEWIEQHLKTKSGWNEERLVIFTEYRDTLLYLSKVLEKNGYSNRFTVLTGGMPQDKREKVKSIFQSSPNESPVRILLATDAASEGIDLQNHCRYLIHYEIPWNPNRMEQRNGRIDRHGQKADKVIIHHFIYTGQEDLEFLQTVVDKVQTMRHDLGSIGEIIASEVEDVMLGLSQKNSYMFDMKKIDLIKKELKAENNLKLKVKELIDVLYQTRNELKIYPEKMKMVLDQALKMNGSQGLEQIISGDLAGKGYRLSVLPRSWNDILPTIKDEKGRLLTLVFDQEVAEDRNDVVLMHLNHPLMKRAIGFFRANMWSEGLHASHALHRVSYQVMPIEQLQYPSIILYVRIVAVNPLGQKVHEQIARIGAQIEGATLNWLDDRTITMLLDKDAEFTNIPIKIANSFRELFPMHEEQLKFKINIIEKSEKKRIQKLLENLVKEQVKSTTDLIKERIKEIQTRGEQEDGLRQTKLLEFSDEERQQYEEDINWLKTKEETLRDRLINEPSRIKKRLTLSTLRSFPLGILYLIPKSMLK